MGGLLGLLFVASFAFLPGERQAGTHYIAQPDPKLSMDPRLATDSCLSLPSASITHGYLQPGLNFNLFSYFLFSDRILYNRSWPQTHFIIQAALEVLTLHVPSLSY